MTKEILTDFEGIEKEIEVDETAEIRFQWMKDFGDEYLTDEAREQGFEEYLASLKEKHQ